MSQVKNLRAMFEGKGDTSPPDRGRSGASTPVAGLGPGGTGSPRPLSKIRTNFVAVEKDGRIGLQRDPSHESSVSRRRLSMETDAESTSTSAEKQSVAASDDVSRGPKSVQSEAIPESPRQPTPESIKTPSPKIEPKSTLGALTDKPSTNPDKHVDQETPSPILLPAEPTEKPIVEEIKEVKATTPAVAVNGKKTNKPKDAPSTTPAKTTTAKKTTTSRPSTISTKPATTIKPPAKSPSAAKTPTSATHKPEPKPEPKPAARLHERTAAKKETAPPARATSRTRQPAATASKKPQSLKPSPNETGFVKPKPKSPTRPVNLPSSLMAPTASSAHKGGQMRQSSSKQSSSLPQSSTMPNLTVPGRSPSRASATGSTAGKTIKRQSSTINRPRPSVGPPPKKRAQDHPVAKKDAPVDEGFLARMMRPTQASAQKTTEKAPVTPPKKTTKRPSTSGTDNSRGSTRRAPSSKASGGRRARSITPSDTASQQGTKSISGKPVTPEATSPEPIPEAVDIEEVSAEAANVETAEEVIELAKEADLVQTPSSPEVPLVKIDESEDIEEVSAAMEEPKSANPTENVEDGIAAMANKLDGLSIGTETKEVEEIRGDSEDERTS